MTDPILRFLEWIGDFNDFAIIGKVFAVFAVIFWVSTIWWVWVDSVDRYRNFWMQLLMCLISVIFPIFGLFVYLLLRNKRTVEESIFIDMEKRMMLSESLELAVCPTCDLVISENFDFCPNCGFQSRIKCASCKQKILFNHKYCPYCGKKNVDYLKNVSGPKRMQKNYAIAISHILKEFQERISDNMKTILEKLKNK